MDSLCVLIVFGITSNVSYQEFQFSITASFNLVSSTNVDIIEQRSGVY